MLGETFGLLFLPKAVKTCITKTLHFLFHEESKKNVTVKPITNCIN